MNGVDVADQLRGQYRFDHWLRNYKWWWSIFLWSFGVLLVNAYKSYTSLMDKHNVPASERLTHYEFRLAVARVWIDQNGDDRVAAWNAERRHQSIPSQDTTARRGPAESATATRTPVQQSLFRESSSSTACLESPKTKSPQLSDASLSVNGKLKGRLEFFQCKHLPVSADSAGKSFAKCGLHRWALGRDGEVRKQILVCQDCNVSLCVDCYGVFHSCRDLTAAKDDLKERMKAVAEKKSPKKAPKGKKKRGSPIKKSTPKQRKKARR